MLPTHCQNVKMFHISSKIYDFLFSYSFSTGRLTSDFMPNEKICEATLPSCTETIQPVVKNRHVLTSKGPVPVTIAVLC